VRLLLVEDDESLRTNLSERLRREGYAVDEAATGQDGLFMAVEYPIDVAVVDLGLPDIDGIEVIRSLRRGGRNTPVLILTARTQWQDKVEGLESGADDYLVKPFHPEELLARLRALVRRSAGWGSDTLTCGPVELDTAAKQVRVESRVVELTAFEYKVLEYLMMNTQRVVSKTSLSEHLYEDDIDRDSNVLEVIVGRLRKKLDPDKRLKPIETIRGQGYKFAIARTVDDDGSDARA